MVIVFASVENSLFAVALGLLYGVFVGIFYGILYGILLGLDDHIIHNKQHPLDSHQANVIDRTNIRFRMFWWDVKIHIQSIALRITLYRAGIAPINYSKFLTYCEQDLLFLRRAGGSFIFRHRYLLEYFASQYTPEKYGYRPESE